MLGDEMSRGLTAGSGNDGAGDADRRIDGEDPNEERRLWDRGGGSMGKFIALGVPGVEGAGDAMGSALGWDLLLISAGAGLLEGIRRPGRSIFKNFPWDVRVNWPSFVFRL